jgi:hypothetical protein
VRSEKALDEKEVISRLTFELSQVERVYVASMHALATSKCKDSSQVSLFFAKLLCAAIIGKNDAHLAIRDWKLLHDFVSLNRKTVYKVAKRIDKVMMRNASASCSSPDASTLPISITRWYKTHAVKKYSFLANDSQWKLLELRADIEGAKDTCPICLGDDYDRCLITRCGHVFCESCVYDMVHTKYINGTLNNLLKSYEFSTALRCPMCRQTNPFLNNVEFICKNKG